MVRASAIINVDKLNEGGCDNKLELAIDFFGQSIGLYLIKSPLSPIYRPHVRLFPQSIVFVVHHWSSATRARDRHPGGEVLSRSDWLIVTRSYSDWSTFMRLGRSQSQSKRPPGMSGGSLLAENKNSRI